MIVRLRSRDGLERIQIEDDATIRSLKAHIETCLGVPAKQMTLSKDKALLTSKEPEDFNDMENPNMPLSAAGVGHGDLVFMHYPFQREVEPSVKKSVFASRGFGAKMTVDDLIAAQTRIERQDTPRCASVSFERHAADAFQQYVRGALAFSRKRGGLLYGSADDQGRVRVDAIYEPPQESSADTLALQRGGEEEQRADFLAERLQLRKVGWIFTQAAAPRDFILSAAEVAQMAALQAELGPAAVTGVVSLAQPEGEDGPEVQFEAFQVSDQAVRLWQEGWFVTESPQTTGITTLRNPKEPKKKDPVIVAGKDVGEVDNDYFLVPVNILDHEGPLRSGFPIENRLTGQSMAELRQVLRRNAAKPYEWRLADFHLLLFLAKQPVLDQEVIAAIADAVHRQAPLEDGYAIMLDSLVES